MEHGYFETLQGNTKPTNILINAIGLPCQAKMAWHACEPAMTIIPNFLATGILAIVASLILLLWAVAFVQRKHGGVILILLSVVQLQTGGGFVSPLVGIVAGVTGTSINMPFTEQRTLSGKFLATLWPWSLVVYLVWLPAEWLLGSLFNDVLVNLGCVLLLFSICLLTLAVVSGIAHDQQLS